MATLSDLEAALDSLLNHPLGISNYQLVKRVEEKAYEAYIFGLCLRGINGKPNPFIFRGAPGQFHSKRRNYGYAEFTLNKQEFEVHAGVEFRGTSGMTHELDVCIMRAEDARKCRFQPDDPPSASLIAGWECKFFDGNLDKVLGRAFVGLVDDFTNNMRISGLCSNSLHSQLRNYFQPQRRPYAHFELTPLRPSNEVIFVSQLVLELRKLTAA
jgi:hypothetical protein